MPTELKVIVKGESFLLLEDQISFDAPNLFTKFISEHSEDPQFPMQLSRSPHLFSIVVEYLCGYKILPLRKEVLPPGMPREMALENLRVDASYYGLSNLVKLLGEDKQTVLVALNPPDVALKAKELPFDPRIAPLFHFPGRLSNFSGGSQYRWSNHPLAFMEFPLQIDLLKSFTITCWYRATSNKGWHTMISMDVPSAPRPLLYISISPEGDWRFEIGVRSDGSRSGSSFADPDRFASDSSRTPVQLRVWTHLTFYQQVEDNGIVTKRALLLNGKELISSHANVHIYNPAPLQEKTQMAILRGSWDKYRTAGFLGQVENIAVFQRVLDREEILAQASSSNMPAGHGLPGDRLDYVY